MTTTPWQTSSGQIGLRPAGFNALQYKRYYKILPSIFCCLLMLGVISGLLSWYNPVTYLSLVILSDDRPESTMDRGVTGTTNIGFMEKSGLFQSISRVRNTTDLEHLFDNESTGNRVFYIDARAWVNAEGKVLIPFIPKTESSFYGTVDLGFLLDKLKSASNKKTILVLNIFHKSDDFLDGHFRDDLWPCARKIITEHTGEDLTVFIPDHQGRPELKIPGTRLGLFTNFFIKGLSGQGEENSTRPDGVIEINDLVQHVTFQMNQWTRRYGFEASEPLVFSQDSGNQPFCHAREIRSGDQTPVLTESYPASLEKAWRAIDTWRNEQKVDAAPLVFAEFTDRLISAEKAWLEGSSLQEVDSLVEKILLEINLDYEKFRNIPSPSFYSVAWYLRSEKLSLDNDKRLESLFETLGKIRLLANDVTAKESKVIEMIESESTKWKTLFTDTKDFILQQAIVVRVASRHVWSSRYDLFFLARCIGEQSRELTIESEFLFQIQQIFQSNPNSDATLLHLMFCNRVLREQILANPEAWPSIMAHIQPVLLKLHEYDLVLRYTNHANLNLIKSEMNLIQEELKTFINDQQIVNESRILTSQSMSDLYWIPRLLESFPQLTGVVERYFNTLSDLDNRISELNRLSVEIHAGIALPLPDNRSNETRSKLNAIRVQLAQLNQEAHDIHLEIWQNVGDKAVEAEMDKLSLVDINQATVNNILELLEFPGCTALTRENARNAMSRFWMLRSKIDEDELFQTSILTHPRLIAPSQNSAPENRRAKAFALIAKFVSPSWHTNKDLRENNSGDDRYLSMEAIEKHYDSWVKSELVASEYSSDINIHKARAGIVYNLIYPFANSSDYISEIYQNYRKNNQVVFYSNLGSLMDYFSIDIGGSSMLRHAAEEIRKITSATRKVSVKIVASPLTVIRETTSNSVMNCAVDMQLIISAIGEKQKPVDVDVVNIADSALQAKRTDELSLVSDSAIPSDGDEIVNVKIDSRLNFSLTRNPLDPQQMNSLYASPNLTLLLKFRIYDYEYHTPVPIYLVWPDQRPQLSFTTGSQPEGALGMKQIKLRPIDNATPLWIQLTNPSPSEMDLTVKMKIQPTYSSDALEWVSRPIVLKPETNARVFFQATLPVKPGSSPSTVAAKPESPPAGQERTIAWPGDLMPVQNEIQFVVTDNRNNQAAPLLQRTFVIRTASPTDIVQMKSPAYDPSKRELKSMFFSRPEFNGTPPARIGLRIPLRSTSEPDSPVIGAGGNLTGLLEFVPDKNLEIVASPVRIDPLQNGAPGRLFFDIDRYERAFVYQNRWLLDYDRELAPMPVLQPEIRIGTEKIWRNGIPIPIRFQPINEPEGAFIVLEAATLADSSGDRLKYREVRRFPTSRHERFAIRFDEKIGSILISNGIQDWAIDMPTTGLIGRISLRARLLHQNGQVLATDTKEILLDDQAVRQANLVDLPEFIKVGNRLRVRLQLVAPASGLNQALAVLGPVKDRKIPETASQVRLSRDKPAPADKDQASSALFETWSGDLLIPAKPELVGNTMITVILETGAGLTEEVTGDLKIVAADFIESGNIQGSVLQGTFPQADLPVVLRKMDAKRTEVARVKTDRQGKFQIPAIAPGRYGIFTAKSLDQTSGQAEVMVKSGQTTIVPLRLGRVNLPSNGPAPKAETSTPDK